MFKIKRFMLIAVLIAVPFLAVTGLNANIEPIPLEFDLEPMYEAVFASNRYTQPETEAIVTDNPLVNLDGYESIAENGQLRLYYKPDDLSIRVEDLQSGYVWGSSFDTTDERLNQTWRARVHSAVWITYFRRTTIRDEVVEEAILSSGMSQITTTLQQDGFTSRIIFGTSKIELTLHVHLTETGLRIFVPHDSIVETENNRIGNLKVYPFLGAVKAIDEVEIPGYTFLPDGAGALMRYRPQAPEAPTIYTKSIYGRDIGLYQVDQNPAVFPEPMIHLPVYGIVHGTNQNAFYARLTEGDTSARVVSYPSGRTTDFYWTFFEMVYRIQYEQPTSRNLGSIVTIQQNMTPIDVGIEYHFLSNQDANYVGMANHYRASLVEDSILSPLPVHDDLPIMLDFLMTEQKTGFLWNQYLDMTSTDAVMSMLDRLHSSGLTNIHVGLKGWSRNGYHGTAPNYFGFDRYSGKSGYVSLFDYLKKANIDTYLHVDYARGYSGAGGYNPMTDLARTIYGTAIQGQVGELDYQWLHPRSTAKIFRNDLSNFTKYGITGLAFDTLGSHLYSTHGSSAPYDRQMSVNTYIDMLSVYDGVIAMPAAHAYMFPHLNSVLDTPMYSSQHFKFTDTVPFLTIVLRGSVHLFGHYTNQYAHFADETLRLIDFGVSPSFILTDAPASTLAETPSEIYNATHFGSLEPHVVAQYHRVNDVLNTVIGATLVQRQVIHSGLVRNTYDNGIIHYINYTANAYVINGIDIPPTEVVVVLS